jgi:hypothetical protein
MSLPVTSLAAANMYLRFRAAVIDTDVTLRYITLGEHP